MKKPLHSNRRSACKPSQSPLNCCYQELKHEVTNHKLKSQSSPPSASKVSVRDKSENSLTQVMARQASVPELDLEQAGARMSLNETSTNRGVAIMQDPENRESSLKVSFNTSRGLLKDFLAARGDDKENWLTHHLQPSIGSLVKEVELVTK